MLHTDYQRVADYQVCSPFSFIHLKVHPWSPILKNVLDYPP